MRDVVAVVDVGNVKVVLSAVVGRTHIDDAQQGTDGIRGFQIETVVADESEDFPVAVDAVVAEHLLCHNLSRTATLVGDVLYKIGIACHNDSYLYDVKVSQGVEDAVVVDGGGDVVGLALEGVDGVTHCDADAGLENH